jgi:hypothetical protein
MSMSAQRLELWRNWGAKLRNNAFVRRELDTSLQQAASLDSTIFEAQKLSPGKSFFIVYRI